MGVPKEIGPFMMDAGVGEPFVWRRECICGKRDECTYMFFFNVPFEVAD